MTACWRQEGQAESNLAAQAPVLPQADRYDEPRPATSRPATSRPARAAVCAPAPWRGRLGVATRLLGAPLRTQDSRRLAQQPHLSVSLAYVRDILAYLQRHAIGMYRLAGNLAPYATHPDYPAFHCQRQECRRELAAVGDEARSAAIRLTMHPAGWVRLDAADEGLAKRGAQELVFAATLLDDMGLDDSSVIVVHASGAEAHAHASEDAGTPSCVGAAQAALGRFARRYAALPAHVRARLVLENGDRSCSLADALWTHRRTGIPVVFDLLHHRCYNPAGLALDEALAAALVTWQGGVRPKVHLSSPRTEMRLLRSGGTLHPVPPLAHQHSDFVNVFDAVDLLAAAERVQARPFDIMIEAKAHDLALLRLREQLPRYAPAYAGQLW